MKLTRVRIGARLRLGFAAILVLLVAVLVIDGLVSHQNRDELFNRLLKYSPLQPCPSLHFW